MIQTQNEPVMNRQKLFAPPAYPGAVERRDIIDAVTEADGCSVVVLQAPAGHGKTTTLCQIKQRLREEGARCAWLGLDEADNDPQRFFPHFNAMLQALSLDSPATAPLSAPKKKNWERWDWVLDRLRDHTVQGGERLALFVDDFQELTNPTLTEFFRRLSERLPASVTMFIGSRSMPDIGLATLSVKHRVRVLRADRLRFSLDEVSAFFASYRGGDINPADLEAIFRRSEGWPAALQLFQLSIGQQDLHSALDKLSASTPRELADYLAESVLDQQPASVREFLIQTSVLTRLSAPLCTAVTGQPDAQQRLEWLERGGLFLQALDPVQEWFQYHKLFAECLLEKLRETPGAEAAAHLRAARWYREQGQVESAIHHFLAARAYIDAAEQFDAWAGSLIAAGQLVTVERWANRLPLSEIMDRPSLIIKYCWALAFLRRNDALQPFLPLLAKLSGTGDIAESTESMVVLSVMAMNEDAVAQGFRIAEGFHLDPYVRRRDIHGFPAFELGAAANVAAYRSMCHGQLTQAREQLALAREFNARGQATFSFGYTTGLVGALLLMQGDLAAAIERMQDGVRSMKVERDHSASGAALVCCLIWACYEAGLGREAEELFDQHQEMVAEAALMDFLAVAYISVSRIRMARGARASAQLLLDDLDHMGRVNRWERLLQAVHWERVRQMLQMGDIDRANDEALVFDERVQSPEFRPFLRFLVNPTLGCIRLAIRNQDFEKAWSLLKHETTLCDGLTQQGVRLQLLQAEYFSVRGDSKAALRHLRTALQLARSGGFKQCFIDEGEDILKLLSEFYRANAGPEADASAGELTIFASEILRMAGVEVAVAHEEAAELNEVELTKRERELLELIVDGSGNREAARRLFVSENTVKFHLKNIYAKLGVRSRARALSVARKQGLLVG